MLLEVPQCSIITHWRVARELVRLHTPIFMLLNSWLGRIVKSPCHRLASLRVHVSHHRFWRGGHNFIVQSKPCVSLQATKHTKGPARGQSFTVGGSAFVSLSGEVPSDEEWATGPISRCARLDAHVHEHLEFLRDCSKGALLSLVNTSFSWHQMRRY